MLSQVTSPGILPQSGSLGRRGGDSIECALCMGTSCYFLGPTRAEDGGFQLMDSSTGYVCSLPHTASLKPLGIKHFYDAFSIDHELDLSGCFTQPPASKRMPGRKWPARPMGWSKSFVLPKR